MGTISTNDSTITAGSYQLDFSFTDQSSALVSITKQLSYNASGTLKVGRQFSQTGRVVEETAANASDVLQPIGLTVVWNVAPEGADRTYISGKEITGAYLNAAGNVKLTDDDDAVTGINDFAKVYIKVVATYDTAWSYAITFYKESTYQNQIANADLGVRIATNNHEGKEYVTTAEITAAGGTKYGQTEQNVSPNETTNPYHTADALAVAGTMSIAA